MMTIPENIRAGDVAYLMAHEQNIQDFAPDEITDEFRVKAIALHIAIDVLMAGQPYDQLSPVMPEHVPPMDVMLATMDQLLVQLADDLLDQSEDGTEGARRAYAIDAAAYAVAFPLMRAGRTR